MFETLASFFLVVGFSLFFSVLLWLCPRLAAILEPYLVVLNSLPKSALAPLLIVWLGANYKTIILAGISVAIFGSILNLYTSFMEIDPDSLKLIRTLGGKRKDELLRVALPSSVPYLLSVMKSISGSVWLVWSSVNSSEPGRDLDFSLSTAVRSSNLTG